MSVSSPPVIEVDDLVRSDGDLDVVSHCMLILDRHAPELSPPPLVRAPMKRRRARR
jgi:hypothetical protein